MFRLGVTVSAGRSGRAPSPRARVCQLLLLLLAACPNVKTLTATRPTTTSTSTATATATATTTHRPTLQSRAQPAAAGRSLVLVQGEQPDFVEPIGNHTVASGRDAQLACKISNLGNYRTAWLRVEDKGILTIHNNVITRNYRFGLTVNEPEQSFVLTIRDVKPSDRGGYMCQINSVPMRYAVGYLDVLTPPVFEEANATGAAEPPADEAGGEQERPPAAASNSSQVTVVEGHGATLSCLARGHPRPSISWRREDGRPILLSGADGAAELAGAPTEIADTNALTFSAASRLMAGAYLCIASNGVQPAASKRQLLDVRYSPTITVPQTEVAGWPKQREAQLECLADSNPAGSHHWVKLATSTTNTDRRPTVANQEDDLWLIEHDELMPSDKFDIVIKQMTSEKVRMVLLIRQVERQDFSWYKCIAKNGLGLQSNFVRFYESPGGAPPATSSFSFKNIVRMSEFAGGAGAGQQQDEGRLNQPQNDDSRLSFQRPSAPSAARSGAASSTAALRPGPPPHNYQMLALGSLLALAAAANLLAGHGRPGRAP